MSPGDLYFNHHGKTWRGAAFISGALRHVSRGRTPFLNPRGWCRFCWVAIDTIPKLSLLPNEDSRLDWLISLWEYASSAINIRRGSR